MKKYITIVPVLLMVGLLLTACVMDVPNENTANNMHSANESNIETATHSSDSTGASPTDEEQAPPDGDIIQDAADDAKENTEVGGDWFYFNREYQDISYNVAYLAGVYKDEISILPEGALNRWEEEVFLKQSEEDQNGLPTMYQAIQGLKISKEDLIALNDNRKELCEEFGYPDEMILPDEYIDALYLPEEEMKKALLNPLALYYEGEIYTWEALYHKDTGDALLKEIPDSVMDEYIVHVITYCLEEGIIPERELEWYFNEEVLSRYYELIKN